MFHSACQGHPEHSPDADGQLVVLDQLCRAQDTKTGAAAAVSLLEFELTASTCSRPGPGVCLQQIVGQRPKCRFGREPVSALGEQTRLGGFWGEKLQKGGTKNLESQL